MVLVFVCQPTGSPTGPRGQFSAHWLFSTAEARTSSSSSSFCVSGPPPAQERVRTAAGCVRSSKHVRAHARARATTLHTQGFSESATGSRQSAGSDKGTMPSRPQPHANRAGGNLPEEGRGADLEHGLEGDRRTPSKRRDARGDSGCGGHGATRAKRSRYGDDTRSHEGLKVAGGRRPRPGKEEKEER